MCSLVPRMEQYVDCLYVFSFLLLGEEQSATPNKRHRRISRKISTRRGQEAVTPICILLFFAGSSECGHHLVDRDCKAHPVLATKKVDGDCSFFLPMKILELAPLSGNTVFYSNRNTLGCAIA